MSRQPTEINALLEEVECLKDELRYCHPVRKPEIAKRLKQINVKLRHLRPEKRGTKV